MSTDIAICYGDLSVVRVPWKDKRRLQTDQVLCIALINNEHPRPYDRQQGAIRNDFYLLAWDDDACCLWGYDDNLYWFNFANPWDKWGEDPKAPGIGFTHRNPFSMLRNSIVFEGVFVDKRVFAQAALIFDDRDGPMYGPRVK